MSNYADFAEFYDILTQNIPYRNRGEYFNAVIKNSGMKGSGDNILLDLGCGTGTLTFIMEELGYDVIGVDNSWAMLDKAMRKKYENNSEAVFLCQPMEKLDMYGTMDYIICALDSLNHITDLQTLQTVFDKVSLFLHPDGLFVFDVNTLYKHKYILANNTYVYDYDDVYCVWQNTPKGEDTIGISLDIFCAEQIDRDENDDYELTDDDFDDGYGYDDEEFEKCYFRYHDQFEERAYSDELLRQMLKKSGLEVVHCYADDSFEPLAQDTQRAVYAVKKIR